MISSRLKHDLVTTIKDFRTKGWAPANATNYSYRFVNNNETVIAICSADADRSIISENDLISLDTKGRPLNDLDGKVIPDDLHLFLSIYKRQDINCILHTHSVNGTVLSMLEKETGKISFQSYKALKALSGLTHKQESCDIPIFSDNNNNRSCCDKVESYFETNRKSLGFMIVGHGLYTWGKDIMEAKRQAEIFEFIFECEVLYRQLIANKNHAYY